MESKELRIGNLIYNPIQKINIVVDGGLITTESMREKGLKDYKGFEPIPLTEEWLLRFGFELLDSYEGDTLIKTYGINITSVNDLEKLIICDFNWDISIGEYESEEFYTLDTDFKHVHQLQNLYFALTGEELKIK